MHPSSRISRLQAEILRLLIARGEMYGLELVGASKVIKRGTIYVTLRRRPWASSRVHCLPRVHQRIRIVVLSAHAAIALGTLSGGWRIIHTMGNKITRLQPGGGFAAETAGAISLFTATALGVPVSTTHTITGAIVGVESARRWSAVRWGLAGRIVWALVLTIPAAATIAASTFYLLDALGMP